MIKRVILAALLMLFPSALSADYVIRHDRGGIIGDYLDKYEKIYHAKTRVIVDGECSSACTIVLALPSAQVCATKRAFLGFHAAWRMTESGKIVPAPDGTELLLSLYPNKVKAWIKRRGGLTEKMLFIKGSAFIRRC